MKLPLAHNLMATNTQHYEVDAYITRLLGEDDYGFAQTACLGTRGYPKVHLLHYDLGFDEVLVKKLSQPSTEASAIRAAQDAASAKLADAINDRLYGPEVSLEPEQQRACSYLVKRMLASLLEDYTKSSCLGGDPSSNPGTGGSGTETHGTLGPSALLSSKRAK
jgi:hypothetical protein